ncbi:WYL domain-containing protein [Spirochaetales bacterium NM-380-WT-3C1]|uniref:WYL domain-containing protein n=1 Tax=Bullifex porci TaxID=2606638 RepID=A0A7X2TRF1_9SPIO|nr:WYL domain-containing protein [Bullifex porci]MSU05903.1 WYL domain-containing protein [Bullifex porci]
MAYSESIRDLERLREIILNFYVDGSKTKDEYLASFYRGASIIIENALCENIQIIRKAGKTRKFISVDARKHQNNPLHKIFFIKSYSSNDISFYFHIIDILHDNKTKKISEITEELRQRYYNFYEDSDGNITQKKYFPDTVRNKLEELVSLGIVSTIIIGNRFEYYIEKNEINLNYLKDSLSFFSNAFPAGFIGEIIQRDYQKSKEDLFVFKHNYLNHVLDADILCVTLDAIRTSRKIEFDYNSLTQHESNDHFLVYPLKIYSSVSEGRQYLFCFNYKNNLYAFFRLDKMHNIKTENIDDKALIHKQFYLDNHDKMWGTSIKKEWKTEHVEFVVKINSNEDYILKRINREKRNCVIKKIDETLYLITNDVLSPYSMIPWIRTFYGKIISISSSDSLFLKEIKEDISALKEYYNAF